MSNICRRGGTTEKTPLKLWLLPLFPLSDQFREAHQQLPPGAEAWDQTRREHSEFVSSRKSCVFWAKEQALQTLLVVCRFHLIHVTEKHRDFAVLSICFVLNDLSRSQMHVVSPSQPASHKTLTSFCLHYKFKIYLQEIKSLQHDKHAVQEQESLGLSPLSVNLFGNWEFVR